MKKPGRNEPCRCGSGKKYKKCCEQKDELEAVATLNAGPFSNQNGDEIFDPVFVVDERSETIDGDWNEGWAAVSTQSQVADQGYDGDSNDFGDRDEKDNADETDELETNEIVDGPYPTISTEDEVLIEQWWDRYRAIDDLDAIQSHLNEFISRRPDLVENLGLEHEMIFELGAQYLREGRDAEYIAFLIDFRLQFPSAYVRGAGHHDKDIIAWLISQNRHDEVANYLNFFIDHPVRFYRQLIDLLNLMLSTNVVRDVVSLLNRVAKRLTNSSQIFYADITVQPLISNILEPYIKATAVEDDVRQFLHEATTTLPFEMNSSVAAIRECLRMLRETARPFSPWPSKLPSLGDDRRKLIIEIGNNFAHYMHKRVGMSWMSARYYGIELPTFLIEYWKIATNKNSTFVFQSQRIANVASSLSADGIFTNITKYMTFLNALYYFADYLETCGNLNAAQAQDLHKTCEKVYNSVMKEESEEDIEAACFKRFPLFHSTGTPA